MKIELLVCMIAFAGLIISCTNHEIKPDNHVQNIPATEYFPNTVGDFWEYEVSYSGQFQFKMKVEIVSSRIMADGKASNLWLYELPTRTDTAYFRIENDTVKKYGSYNDNLKFPELVFPIPFSDGQQWSGNLIYYDSYTALTDSVGSDGFMIHHHYMGPNMDFIDKFYFKPKIGFMQIDQSHSDLAPVFQVTQKLVQYKLK